MLTSMFVLKGFPYAFIHTVVMIFLMACHAVKGNVIFLFSFKYTNLLGNQNKTLHFNFMSNILLCGSFTLFFCFTTIATSIV